MRDSFNKWGGLEREQEKQKGAIYDDLSQSTHLKIFALLEQINALSYLGAQIITELSRRRDNIVRIHFTNHNEKIVDRLKSLDDEIMMLRELERDTENFNPNKYRE